MDKWFHKLPKWLRVVLLFIPFVNWVFEMLVRWSLFIRKGAWWRLVISLVVTFFFGVLIGIFDAIWTIIYNEMVLE